MINREAVREVRDVLFYFQKAYADLEFKTHMPNSSEIDSKTLDYLEKVKSLFEDYGDTIDELKKHYMKVIASSIKEDKNDKQ